MLTTVIELCDHCNAQTCVTDNSEEQGLYFGLRQVISLARWKIIEDSLSFHIDDIAQWNAPKTTHLKHHELLCERPDWGVYKSLVDSVNYEQYIKQTRRKRKSFCLLTKNPEIIWRTYPSQCPCVLGHTKSPTNKVFPKYKKGKHKICIQHSICHFFKVSILKHRLR